ncbi:MAG TPA: serine hydrolase domain-containing protein [Gemmatimonadaceae bacterium]
MTPPAIVLRAPSRALRLALPLLAAIAAGTPSALAAQQLQEPAAAPVAAEGAATRALRAWVATFDRGDSAAIARFVDSAFAPAQFARRPAAFIVTRDRWRRRNLGPIEVVAMDVQGDTMARALVRNALVDSWGHVELHLDPAAPHRITSVDLTRHEAAPAARAPHGRLGDAAVATALGRFARTLADSGLFSGTVLVTHRGRTVFEGSYGLADEGRGIPNAAGTRFQLASSAKMFTGVAILQLASQGKLSLSDPVVKWIPEFANADAARRITVHHLLTQSSGLADFMPSPAFDAADKSALKGLADYLRFFAAESLAFEPGSQWQYRNSNYLLLGLVAERASGMSYRDYWRAYLFTPAGMRSVWADGPAAVGYSYYWPGRRLDPSRRRAVGDDLRHGTPVGGGVATAGDMARFANALMEGKLLPAAWRDTMFAGRTPEAGPGARAAYGFDAAEQPNGVRVLSKGGYVDGALAQVELYPDDRWVVVVLTNTDLWGGEAVAAKARMLVTQR